MRYIKRFILPVALCLSLAVLFSACGGGQAGKQPEAKTDATSAVSESGQETMPAQSGPQTPETTVNDGGDSPANFGAGTDSTGSGETASKILVAYFSATGNTRKLAEYAADVCGADLYEIVPEVPYTDEDLNYNDRSTRATAEQNDGSARPAISGGVANMEQYDIILLGYPIWWGDAPRILCTFVESYDFSGKTVIPFCTSGSSGIGASAKELQGYTAGATWLEGARLSGGMSKEEMADWINGLGLGIAVQ